MPNQPNFTAVAFGGAVAVMARVASRCFNAGFAHRMSVHPDVDLGEMGLDELQKLQNGCTKAIDSFWERQKQEALTAAEAS